MDCNVVVVCPEEMNPEDEKGLQQAVASVKAAGFECKTVSPEEALSVAVETDAEYCHLMTHRCILLPDFYTAMLTSCEHYRVDYSFCHLLSLNCGSVVTVPSNPESSSQLVIRTWVLRELAGKDIEKTLARVIAEYGGTAVPHVLCLELT